MNDAHLPLWLETALGLLHGGEIGLLAALDLLHLVPRQDGQPLWPFAWRFDDHSLRTDLGLARHAVTAAALYAIAAVGVSVAVLVRRARWPALFVATASVLMAPIVPWPLLVTDAVPTSFLRAPAAFTSDAIVAGRRPYVEHCAACHGADARGEGPRAAELPMWPPTLTRGLLSQRPEGELFWRVQHGMHARDGTPTMPGFAGKLGAAATWAVLDYARALAAGVGLAESAHWTSPVAVPDAAIRCDGSDTSLRRMNGRRLRIVFAGSNARVPAPDPRVTTIVVSENAVGGDDCEITDRPAWDAFALVAGVRASDLPGTQFLVDRDGWLRARSRPDSADWSSGDYLCRTPRADDAVRTTANVDGLGLLIARMDRERLGGVPVPLAALR